MYIWIDESYDENGYIVLGALIVDTTNKMIIEECHSSVLRKIKKHNKNHSKKISLTNAEFHECDLFKDKHLFKIKSWIFDALEQLSIKPQIGYIYTLTEQYRNLNYELYKIMIVKLISNFFVSYKQDTTPIYITMDNCYTPPQRKRLQTSFKEYFSDNYIFDFKDSHQEKGLQFADIIVGTVRRRLNHDEKDKENAMRLNSFKVYDFEYKQK